MPSFPAFTPFESCKNIILEFRLTKNIAIRQKKSRILPRHYLSKKSNGVFVANIIFGILTAIVRSIAEHNRDSSIDGGVARHVFVYHGTLFCLNALMLVLLYLLFLSFSAARGVRCQLEICMLKI